MGHYAGSYNAAPARPGVDGNQGGVAVGPANMEPRKNAIVEAFVEKLDSRLRAWKPETAAQARERIAELIDLADHGVLDLSRSRAAEQQILNLLDNPPAR
jgi:predicted component of type VI protein secretion system